MADTDLMVSRNQATIQTPIIIIKTSIITLFIFKYQDSSTE